MHKINVNEITGCWEWAGHVRADGYAQTTAGGRKDYVHRIAWRAVHGPIAPGSVIDHLCKVRHCCNPKHMEAVPQSVNVQRGNLPALTAARNTARSVAQTHCKRGHEFTPENTHAVPGHRVCKECRRARGRGYDKKRRSPNAPDS
jgi:HNH endonuclease